MSELINKNIEDTLSSAFLEYAGYNLQRRAIPDARDGLKWGARQILHAQMLGKFTYDKPFKKAVKTVAQAMGFSYVHGDASAYGTLIRMAKPFSMEVPLQEANGNYGTIINPDDHSASRYVELRGSRAAAMLLQDLDKDTINEWEDTYDLEGQFPKVLPAKGFWNLVNGAISIGSGMACSIPTFNLKEMNEKLIELLWNPEMKPEDSIVLPDFPTGAIILNEEEVRQSLINGTGKACRIRSVIEYDKQENCLIVKEMPYSTFTNTVCNELANYIQENENCGIKDFVDYSGKEPDLRIYLTKNANPQKVIMNLYKNTSLQTFYTINMVLLDNGTMPRVFGMKEAMLAHLTHEKIVYTRSFQYDLNKILARLHIIEGLLKAIDMMDEVIATIKKSSSTAMANNALQKLLSIDEAQAKAILEIKLARLARMEINKLINEQSNLNAEKNKIEKILADENLLKKEIENGLREAIKLFAHPRRTKIMNLSTAEDDEPIEIKSLVINATNEGNLYVEETSSLYTQKRGKVGSKFKLDDGESIISTITCQSNDNIFLFTDSGNYYSLEAKELPVGSNCSIHSFVNFKTNEKLCALSTFSKDQFVYFVTKNGYIKKSKANEYSTGRKSGAKAITLGTDDRIVSVLFGEGILALTSKSNILLVDGKKINPIGRIGRGIAGMKLNDGDEVVCAALQPAGAKTLIILTKSGKIKQVERKILSIQGSGTKGRRIVAKGEETAGFCFYTNEKDVLISTTSSQIKIAVKDIPSLDTTALGNKAIELKSGMECIGVSVDN